MKYKNILFSFISFVLAFIEILFFDTAVITESVIGSNINDYIAYQTGYAWMGAINVIAFLLYVLISVTLLIASIIFALKVVKEKNKSSKFLRLAGLIMLTISGFSLISGVIVNIYLALS